MENEQALTKLFQLWSEQKNPPIIELLDHEQRPVGALYLNKLRDKGQLVISQTLHKERFYLYCDGLGIFFSFYKKLQLSEDTDA